MNIFEIIPHPDTVGSTEHRAIWDALEESGAGSDRDLALSILEEFEEQAKSLQLLIHAAEPEPRLRPEPDQLAITVLAHALLTFADRDLEAGQPCQIHSDNGYLGVIEGARRIAETVESLGCQHVDFDESDHVWPYWLADHAEALYDACDQTPRVWGSDEFRNYILAWLEEDFPFRA